MRKSILHKWPTCEIADVLSVPATYGANAPSVPFSKALPRYIRITDIDENGNLIEGNPRSVDPSSALGNEVQPGDLLLARSGATVGKSYLHRQAGVFVHAGYLIRLRPDQSKIDPEYLFQFTRSPSYLRWVELSQRAGAQPNINATEYSRLRITLPTLPEQRRIAEILRTWDEAIEKTNRLITKKHSVFNRIREELSWDGHGRNRFVAIGEVLTQSTQRVGVGRDLRVFSVTKDGLVPQDEHFNKRISNEDVFRHMLVEYGDVTLSGLNFWLGSVDVSLSPEAFCISPDYKVFKISDEVEPSFFRHLVRTDHFRHILRSCAVERASVVRKNFDRERFLESEIPLPSVERQRRIVELLDVAEREHELHITHRDALAKQKRGLMKKLLTGEWPVSVPKTKEAAE